MQHLLDLFSSADPDQREQAGRELQAFLPDDRAVDALIELLGDSDWRVRRASIESILTGDPQIMIPRILQGLYDEENAGRRNAAIDLLNRFGKAIVPYLGTHLKSGNRDVQMFLIQMLGDLRDRTYFEEIVHAVEYKEDNVVSAAILALGKIGHPGSLPLILRLLQTTDPWTRFQAIEAAGEMRDPGVLPVLIQLRDSPYCRSQILKTLARFQDPEAFRALIHSLFRENRLDQDALEALSSVYSEHRPAPLRKILQERIRKEFRERIGNDEIQVLIGELENASPEQKKQILELIGWSRFEAGIRVLTEHLSDPELGECAARGLANCGEAAIKPLFTRLHAEASVEEIVAILTLLDEIQASTKPDDLKDLLEHSSAEVRHLAYRLLIHSSDDLPVEILARGVLDGNSSIQELCLQPLLSRSRNPNEANRQVLTEMRERLHSKIASERGAALEFLARLEPENSGSLLLQSIKDADPPIRREAAALMQSMYDVSFRRPLMAALADEDARVRELAIRALRHDPSVEVTDVLLSAMRDESLWVRIAAYESLAADPHGGRTGAALREQLKSENPAACAVLLRCLAAIPGAISNELLLQYTQSPDPEIRKSACEALSSAPPSPESALRTIAEQDPDWKVRVAALQTIARLVPSHATGILHARWKSERDPYVRRQILSSLREAQADLLPSDLFQCLLDPHLADDAYEYLRSMSDRLAFAFPEAALSQPPAIRRILQTIFP